ncbi:DUF4870 domain-containing protein [Gracilibacillus alcaliphilus]|uniref:DUF4870 domain-containing protein n=1 Tax=Gracilibacillus alcaliphilus TaxID=1401441 RepID=UPI00195AD016|nr:DUF4870 domain-containing protein [Gracilibacillus alcaliphilus]MBM7679239.1 cation transport ATPase [Gracilibacillus alcaliphilus]
MEGNKLLSSLCYFSIFFAPLLFPILVWIFGDEVTKPHAKKALWTHIIPALTAIAAVLVIGFLGIWQFQNNLENASMVLLISTSIAMVVCFLISLYFLIWNIVKGIQILIS